MQKNIAQFQIQDMLPIGLTLVVLGIGLSYGLSVLGDIKGDMAVCDQNATSGGTDYWNATNNLCVDGHGNFSQHNGTAEYNATGDAMTGVAKLPEKLPLIVTVIVAAIIIGILVRYLLIRFN